MKTKEKIDAINKRLKNYETELEPLTKKPTRLKEIKGRIEEIDRTLMPLKAEMAQLRVTYTDNWPAVAQLKNKIDMLESEKQKLAPDLAAAQEMEDKKADIMNKINADKKGAEALQDELKAIDNRLGQIEQAEKAEKEEAASRQDALEKKEPNSRIITPPTQKISYILVELGIRLFAAAIIGVVFWLLIGLLLKNAYLFWVLKDRLFRKR